MRTVVVSSAFNKYAALFAEIDRKYKSHMVIKEAHNWREYDREQGLTEKAWIVYVEEAFGQLEIAESDVDMGMIMNIALMPDYVPPEYTKTSLQSPGISVKEIDNTDGKFRYLPGPVRVDR